MYAGALGNNSVKYYALFLTPLVISADPVERHVALQRPQAQAGCPHVPQSTIERVLDKLPSSVKGPLPDLAMTVLEPTEVAMLLVRSIEYAAIMTDTHDTSLNLVNVILQRDIGRFLHSPARQTRKAQENEMTVIGHLYSTYISNEEETWSWKGEYR